MPLDTRSLRDRSSLGRFPTVTLAWGAEPEDEKAEPESEAGSCTGWLCRMCPCCHRHKPGDPSDTSDTLVTDDGEKPSQPGEELQDVLLTVRSVDLLKSKKGQNRTEHHTDRYHDNDLVIRRGQTFQMWMELSRPFDPSCDKLHLELRTGSSPSVPKGTHVIVPLVDELEDNRWEAKIVKQKEKRLQLSVNSPANALIGRYKLTVVIHCPKGITMTTHDPDNDIYMLFNPWSIDDAVYMEDDDERKEYVLNDVGRLYYGTEKQIGERTWNYGQFDEGVLDACLFVLDQSNVPPLGRADPVRLVRVISAMVNSPDDRGVLEGNWSGDYSDGTSPTSWSGSVEILKKYQSDNGLPVKYGQCWVFSGVTTTVLRCLGIPARSVTNFNSAHDTDVSLTTDVFFDEDLQPLDDLNTDSIWNFHVWNDCWMARADLPPGMGGWQAVDSTPQETSEGTFRCGPASVSAVRSGLVYLKHDTPFVFAEVNSDKIYWQRNRDGTFSQFHLEKNTVGRSIVTKAVGSNQRNDITLLYKHPEGSEEERIAVETACRYGSRPDVYSPPCADDVLLDVCVRGEGPRMGADAQLSITLQNGSAESRTLTLHSQAAVMYYTGVLKANVKQEQTSVELSPHEVKTLSWVLEYQSYQDQLVDQAALMLTLCGRVTETRQLLATQFNFRLQTPDLVITPVGDAVVGKEMSAKICFTNPLPQTLKSVVMRVEGLGLQTARQIVVGDVGRHCSLSVTDYFIPSLAGQRKLVASLDCRQLTQVHGVVDITVRET